MLVSILIPVYNREVFIKQTITSAINQSYTNIEIVVVDNSSTDGTWDIVMSMSEQDHRIKAFRNEKNIGPVRNWRRCLDESKGEYAKILWSDDLIDVDFVKKCMELMDDETAFVYSAARIFRDCPNKGKVLYSRGKTEYIATDEFINLALYTNEVPVSPGCALFRKKDIDSNLLIDIDNKIGSDFSMHAIGNDLLLFLLTARDYKKCACVCEPLALFRHHSNSISVSSTSVKLSLHYNLAKAFFCENYYPSSMQKFVAHVWIYLKLHPEVKLYDVHSLTDVFMTNVHLKFRYVVCNLLLRVIGLINRLIL